MPIDTESADGVAFYISAYIFPFAVIEMNTSFALAYVFYWRLRKGIITDFF
jgi:hypothetical protein